MSSINRISHYERNMLQTVLQTPLTEWQHSRNIPQTASRSSNRCPSAWGCSVQSAENF